MALAASWVLSAGVSEAQTEGHEACEALEENTICRGICEHWQQSPDPWNDAELVSRAGDCWNNDERWEDYTPVEEVVVTGTPVPEPDPVPPPTTIVCPYTGLVVSRPEDCPEYYSFGGGGGVACGGACVSDGEDESEATDSSSLGDFAADSETVLSCAANPVTSGHRSVFSLLDSEVASLPVNMRPIIHTGYGDAKGALGHAYKDPTTGDIHMVIDKEAIDTEVTGWRNAGIPISHWQVLAGTLIHEAYHVLDMVQCRCGTSDEQHTDRRANIHYYDTFGVYGYQHPSYRHDRDGSPNCLPQS